MKTRIPSLVACLFLLAAVTTFAAGEGEPVSGTLQSFTATSMTIAYKDASGQVSNASYIIDATTTVMRLDQVMPWLDVARKGLAVHVVPQGVFAKAIHLPFYGLETQGYGSATAKVGVYAVTDIRENTTDSNLTAPSERKDAEGRVISKVEVIALPPETDNAWALSKPTEIMIGNIDVIEGSVKIKLDGMFLNVAYGVDGKGVFFDPPGTSCVVDKTKGVTTIRFDQDLGKSYDEVAPKLELSFQKKMMIQRTTEITYLEKDPSCVVEVNGEGATMEEATTLANFWLVRCNTDNRMIHVDAYMLGREASMIGSFGSTFVVKIGPGKGTLVAIAASEGITVLGAAGTTTLASLAQGTPVYVTTEPAEQYHAVLVSVSK